MTNKEFCVYFARNLTEILRDRNINKSELGRQLGFDKSGKKMWDYCNGKSLPGLYRFFQICDALDICPQQLWKENNDSSLDCPVPVKRQIDHSRLINPDKNALYGCEDCEDHRTGKCRYSDVCKYADFFGHYRNYREYVEECETEINAEECEIKNIEKKIRIKQEILKILIENGTV